MAVPNLQTDASVGLPVGDESFSLHPFADAGAPDNAGFACERTIPIADAAINLKVRRSDMPVDRLCDFALRNNPNRAILVVSRVAGRHIPVKPSRSRAAYELLTKKIPADLPGPVVVIGLAESAIGIGNGVYEEFVKATGRDDVIFIHSSRHKLSCPVAVHFHEEHSHATQEWIYFPEDDADREMFVNARSVVIVEDELTTGRTVQNLARSLQEAMPLLENVVVSVLADWRAEEYVEKFPAGMPVASCVVSLLEGSLSFVPGTLQVKVMPKLVGNGQPKDGFVSGKYGRRGHSTRMSGRRFEASAADGQGWSRLLSRSVGNLHNLAKGRCLVLATEEFAFPPFLLAEALEAAGHDVRFQSTTRTPAIPGYGCMRSALTFKDNYGDGIPNFLYNVRPGMYDTVFLCHETPRESLDESLIRALGAHTIQI